MNNYVANLQTLTAVSIDCIVVHKPDFKSVQNSWLVQVGK